MLSLTLGPISLPIEVVFTILSILIFYGMTHLFTRSTPKLKQGKDKIFNAVFVGFIVARIAFVMSMWEIYQHDLVSIIDIRDGGFNNLFGWLGGAIYLLVSARGNRLLISSYLKSAMLSVVIVLPLVIGNALLSHDRTFTDISVTDNRGQQTTLVEYKGKPAVINLWASWCPPCRREMPILEAAQQHNPDIHFVFLNQQEEPSKVNRFLEREQLSLENVYFDFTGAAASQMGSFGLPTTLFFDANGKLISSHMGELSDASLTHYLKNLKQAL